MAGGIDGQRRSMSAFLKAVTVFGLVYDFVCLTSFAFIRAKGAIG